jgi:hypothetical protein
MSTLAGGKEQIRMMTSAVPKAAKVKVFNYGVHSARDYWMLVTKPDIEAFKELRSPRTAAHVVQSLWAQLEWYAEEQGNEPKSYFEQCPALAWIKDIANSAKHRALKNRQRQVQHMGIRNTGALAYGVAGGYASSEPVVILDDGREHRLIDLLPEIEALWQVRFPDGIGRMQGTAHLTS